MVCNIIIDINNLWITSDQEENNDTLFSDIRILSSSPTELPIYGTLTITKIGDNSPVLVEKYGFRPSPRNPSGTEGLLGAGFVSYNHFNLPRGILHEGDKLAINAIATVQSPDGSRAKVSAATVEVILKRKDEAAMKEFTKTIGANGQLAPDVSQYTPNKEKGSQPHIKFLDADALLIINDDSEPMLLVYQRLESSLPEDTLKSISTRIKKTDSPGALLQVYTNGYDAPPPPQPVKDISGIKGVAFECAYKFPAGSIVAGDELEFLSYGIAVANDGSLVGVITNTITTKVRLG